MSISAPGLLPSFHASTVPAQSLDPAPYRDVHAAADRVLNAFSGLRPGDIGGFATHPRRAA